jgi:hypothetical protein
MEFSKRPDAARAAEDLRVMIAQGEAALAACKAAGGQTGGGGPGGGSGGPPAPEPSATNCGLTATAISEGPLDTLVQGDCNGTWDYFEIEVNTSGKFINGWTAHSDQACIAYDINGNEVQPSGGFYPANTIKKLRCFRKTGDRLVSIKLAIDPDPPAGTSLEVTLFRNNTPLFEVDLVR